MKKTEQEKRISGTDRKDRQPGMTVVEILEKLPAPKKDYNLSPDAKRWYRLLGKVLLETKRLSNVDIPNLILLADNWAQWAWANKAINEKNAKKPGEGWVQTFKNNTTNITTEYKIKRDAEDAIIKTSKLFGMNFKDRHAISSFFEDHSGQLNMFDQMTGAHPDNSHLKVIGEK